MTFDLQQGRARAAKAKEGLSLSGILSMEDVMERTKDKYDVMDSDRLRGCLNALQALRVTRCDRMYNGDSRELYEPSSRERMEIGYIQNLISGRERFPKHGMAEKMAWTGNVGMQCSLFVGEQYEEAFVAYMRALGVPSERYRQINIPSDDYSYEMPKGRFLRKDMFQKWQRDVYVTTAAGRRLNVEIKSLGHGSIHHSGMLAGAIGKWDNKRFPVHICLIIKQATGEMFWAMARKEDVKQWQIVESQQTSYLIPNKLLMPIERLIKLMGYVV